MLSDMHDKLSQAVKLYDQILTQQVAQPRWRTSTAAPVSPGPYQQPHQPYATSYGTNAYSQWTPQAHAQLGYQQPTETKVEPVSPPMTFTSPVEQQSQYGMTSRPDQQPQWYQQQQPPYQPQSQLQYASVPSVPSSIPPTSIQSPQYAQSQYQPYSTSSTSSTSAFAPPSNVPQLPPQSQFQTPTAQPQTTTLQPQPANTTALGRHNSVAYAPSPPAASPTFSHHLGRSNTVASSTPQFQRQQYQAPPAQQQSAYNIASPPPVQAALPQFPSVPTSAPQPTFGAYAPSIPSGFEERKEALLIDL